MLRFLSAVVRCAYTEPNVCVTKMKCVMVSMFNKFLALFFLVTAGYEKVNKETTTKKNVFFENKKVCNNGRARYQLDLARAKNYSVTEDFAAAVCALPETYEQDDYLRFVENWGTVSVLNFLPPIPRFVLVASKHFKNGQQVIEISLDLTTVPLINLSSSAQSLNACTKTRNETDYHY